MNPASEATLAELLAVNKQMAGAVSQLAAKSSGGGGGSSSGGGGGSSGPGLASKSFGLLGDAASGLGRMFTGTLGVAAGLVGAGFSQVAKTGSAVYQAQKQLANSTQAGTGKLESFAESLGNLPGILGMIANAYAYQQRALRINLETYQKISDSGAMLGGSLSAVKLSAQAVGLGMSEFADLMKANTGNFLRMGGTAEDGAQAMLKFNKAMVNGDTGRKIMNLGFNAAQANNLLGLYAETMGGISSSQLADQKGMEKSVKDFATELTLSAALEGVSREEKMKQMKEDAKNGARNNMLAQMSEKDRTAYLQAEDRARAIGGKGAADALLSMRLGLPPMTKEAQKFTAIQGEANKSVKELNDVSKNSALSEEERNKQMDSATAKGQKSVADSAKKYGQTAVALAMQGDSSMNAALNANARAVNQGTKTEEDYKNNITKTREQVLAVMEKTGKDSAGQAEQAAMKAKYQAGIMDKLNAILARFFPIVVSVVEAFMKVFDWSVNMGSKILDKVLIPAFNEIFGGIKAADLMKPFKDFWRGLTGGFTSGEIDFTKVKDTIVAFVKPIVDTFGSLVKSIDFEAVGKYLRTFVIGIKDFATGVFGSFKSVDTGSIVVFFKSFFSGLSHMYGLLAESIGRIDFKGIGEGLGRALKTVFDAIRDIFQPVFEKAGPIFSQIGSELGPVFNDIADIINIVATAIADSIGAIVKIISNILVPVLKPIISGLMDAVLPFWEAVKNFIKIVKALLQGDFKSLPQLFSNMWKGIIDAFKELISGIWEGVKTLFSPSKWFDGVGDKKAETKTQATPNTQAAASQNQGAIDKLANDWAYSVYSGKNTLAQVPKDALAKVQDILKNPPGNWKAEVNKTQQQNATAPKTETQTAQNTAKTAEKKEEKVAATPAVDLNNKDALVVLKTLADYQRRTIDAVNNLNGNILKRA